MKIGRAIWEEAGRSLAEAPVALWSSFALPTAKIERTAVLVEEATGNFGVVLAPIRPSTPHSAGAKYQSPWLQVWFPSAASFS